MTMPMTLRSPEHAVALVPHLLGFWPEESLIAIWIADGQVVLTQRVDLPVDLPADRVSAFAEWFVGLGERAAPSSALIVVVTQDVASRADLGTSVGDAVDALGIDLLDVLWTHADRFGSLLCDEGCCPPEGRDLTHGLRDDIAAAFAMQERTPLASREELAASVDRDVTAVEQLLPGLAAVEQDLAVLDPKAFAAWRRRQVPVVGRALDTGHDVSASDMVAIATGLADVQVRDVVMWHLARGGDLRDAVDALTHTVRALPDGYVAPVATCLAMTAWFCGDGALAGLALERARLDDPEYSLARLTEHAVDSGLPPHGWRATLAAMTEAEVRAAEAVA